MKAILPALFVALAACATPGPPPSAASTATVGIGETASLGPFKVRPVALVEDSRCPANVQCVWAGRLILLAEISGVAGKDNAHLTLGEPHDRNGHALTLVGAAPERIEGVETRPGDYRFTFSYRASR